MWQRLPHLLPTHRWQQQPAFQHVRPTAPANLRLWRDCHVNAKAAEQFSQQMTAALRVLTSQACTQRFQQRRTSHFGKWRIAPGCKSVALALCGLALG